MKYLIFIFCFLFVVKQSNAQLDNTQVAFPKKHFAISLAYGTPGIMRTFIRKQETLFGANMHVRGYGSFVGKIEYHLIKHIGVVLNATYNYTNPYTFKEQPTFAGPWEDEEFGVRVKEFSGTIRANYHFMNRKHWNMYAGLGIGTGYIEAKTYTLADYGGFESTNVYDSPIMTEATFGVRYFPIKNVGIFSEVGLGKGWILFQTYFVPDAFIQNGIVIQF
jgi:opacity protein-like surface antigen